MSRAPRWLNATVLGIVLATFWSDVSHEMATVVLPLFLGQVGLGAAALGLIEGVADLIVCGAKLTGGAVGHRVRRKAPVAAAAYLATALATGAMALATGLAALVALRSAAWVARGFRSPLRDYLLADAVEPTHYGRVYGVERTGDMLGAVTGPLLAVLLVYLGWRFDAVLLLALGPGLLAALAMFLFVRDRPAAPPSAGAAVAAAALRPAFPRLFWWFLGGVFLFGLGDFSRAFLVLLSVRALGETGAPAAGTVSVAMLLFALHNLVSAAAAYPVGWLGDRRAKLPILVAGYALGALTNALLAVAGGTVAGLVTAVVLSGVYIAVEETLEKATAATVLPRELRSLGFGLLAGVNAVGDLASSLYVGFLLDAGRPAVAFGVAAGAGVLGVLWMLVS